MGRYVKKWKHKKGTQSRTNYVKKSKDNKADLAVKSERSHRDQ